MSSVILVYAPSSCGIAADTVLAKLRTLAAECDLILDGPIKFKGPLPATEAERFSRVSRSFEGAARRRRIGEGLARAKAQGRRIGRPPSVRPVTAAQIILDRTSGRSWRSIEAEYRIPMTSARRYYQNALLKGEGDSASTKEAELP